MELTCDKCALSPTCPKKGASPLITNNGKTIKCQLIGNYGAQPVEVGILSAESKARMEKDGPCTSYVEVPNYNQDAQKLVFETVIVFHPPIMHERARPQVDVMNRPYRRSYKI
jgi:hypothetical protein